MSATDEDAPNVGVITAIEHVDGETIPINEVTKEHRKQWAAKLKRELEDIDGIDSVYEQGWSYGGDSVALEVALETNGEPKWKDGVYLDANPRSVSPRLRNACRNDDYASAHEVTVTPEPIDADEDRYASHVYVVDIWYP